MRRILRVPALVLLAHGGFAMPAAAFDFDDVARRAADLAQRPYAAPAAIIPKALQELSYDQYRDIRFKPAKAIWRGSNLPFELQMFHPGARYNQPVRISEIAGGAAREVRFDPELFDYGKNLVDARGFRGLGFAGSRVHFPVNNAKYKDEVLVFQGASYFRALGKDQRYGLSARGLAVDTGLGSGEEFPRFVEFWIEKPQPNARALTIYGLLDSRRVTGAYVFVLRPGAETVTTVKTRLYLRENVTMLGIAPLTSMFLFGENQPHFRVWTQPLAHAQWQVLHSGPPLSGTRTESPTTGSPPLLHGSVDIARARTSRQRSMARGG